MKNLLAVLFTLGAFTSSAATETFTGGIGLGSGLRDGEPSVYEFDSKTKTFTWTVGEELMVKGEYLVKGKYLIVTDIEGPRACIGDDLPSDWSTAIYRWNTYSNGQYLLVVEDECGGRQRGFLGASPFVAK